MHPTTLKSRRFVFAFVFLLAPGLAVDSFAQAAAPVTSASTWSITPFGGLAFSGDLDGGTGTVGLAGGYGWSDRVLLEGEFSTLPSTEQSGVVELDSSVWSITGNVLYRFGGRRALVPYAVGGLGVSHASVDTENNPTLAPLDTSSTRFIVTIGGGVERPVHSRFAVRGDLRYLFGGNLVPDYWRLTAGLTVKLR